jgi:cytochrome c553
MSDRRSDTWLVGSFCITAVMAVAAIAVGFVWLPSLDATSRFQSVWSAICSAAGLVQAAPGGQPIQQAAFRTTEVEVVPAMLQGADPEAIGRGATLALRCTMCHGPRGLSEAESPNLAGQYAIGIYKQLVDFKTGARTSAVMQPLVANLGHEDMRDLAVYYAYLPRVPASHSSPTPEIVATGAPMRGVAPCGACHGSIGAKAGATWLDGQPIAYLHAQLTAFALGTRRNDIDAQMRNVARQMTPEEIEAASRFYSQHP